MVLMIVIIVYGLIWLYIHDEMKRFKPGYHKVRYRGGYETWEKDDGSSD